METMKSLVSDFKTKVSQSHEVSDLPFYTPNSLRAFCAILPVMSSNFARSCLKQGHYIKLSS